MADGIQRRQLLCHARNSLQTQNTTPVHTTQPNTHTVKHSKYLGVTFSDDPTWCTHISNVVGDASRTLNFLRRTLRIASQNTKALAYKVLVRPKLEYARPLYMGSSAPRQVEECVRGSTEPSRTICHTPMAQYQQCHCYEA